MRKIKLLTVIFCLLLTTGCGNNKDKIIESTSTATEELNIQCREISCVDGFSFCVREKDFNGDFLFNPSTLKPDSPAIGAVTGKDYVTGENYPCGGVPIVPGDNKNSILIMKNDYFELYNKGNYVYLAGTLSNGEMSSLYYAKNLEELSSGGYSVPFDKNGLTNLSVVNTYYVYSNTEQYILCSFKGAFTFNDDVYNYAAVFIENGKGQYYYITGFQNDLFSDIEINALVNSLKITDTVNLANTDLYNTNNKIIDVGGRKISFTASDLLGFVTDREGRYYNDMGILELSAYNEYFNVVSFYRMFFMPDVSFPVADFLKVYNPYMFSNIVNERQLTDAEGRIWMIYDYEDCKLNNYENASVYTFVEGNYLYSFTVEYGKQNPYGEKFVAAMDNLVSTVTITQGTSEPLSLDDNFLNYYNSIVDPAPAVYVPPIPPADDVFWTTIGDYEETGYGTVSLKIYNPDGKDMAGYSFSVCEETTGEGSDLTARGVGMFITDILGMGHASYNGYNPQLAYTEGDINTDTNLYVTNLPLENVLDITANEGMGEVSSGVYSICESSFPEGASDNGCSFVIRINGIFAAKDENGIFVPNTEMTLENTVITADAGEKIFFKVKEGSSHVEIFVFR